MWEVSSAMQTQAKKKDCDKDNSTGSCTSTDSNLNSNNRPHKSSLLMVKEYTVDYSLSEMTNNEPTSKETDNEIEYFFFRSTQRE